MTMYLWIIKFLSCLVVISRIHPISGNLDKPFSNLDLETNTSKPLLLNNKKYLYDVKNDSISQDNILNSRKTNVPLTNTINSKRKINKIPSVDLENFSMQDIKPEIRSWIPQHIQPEQIMNFNMMIKPMSSEPYYVTNYLKTPAKKIDDVPKEKKIIVQVPQFTAVNLRCEIPELNFTNYQVKWTTKNDLSQQSSKIRVDQFNFLIKNTTTDFQGIYECHINANLTINNINKIYNKEKFSKIPHLNGEKYTQSKNDSSTTSRWPSIKDNMEKLGKFYESDEEIDMVYTKFIELNVEYTPNLWMWVKPKKQQLRRKTTKTRYERYEKKNMSSPEILRTNSYYGELEMHCLAKGFPLPLITWYLNTTKIKNSKTGEHQIIYNYISRTVMKSVLTLANVSTKDFGMYHCKSINPIGHSEKFMLLHDGHMGVQLVLDVLTTMGPPDIITRNSKEISLSFFIFGMTSPIIIGLYIVVYLVCYKPLPRSEIDPYNNIFY